MSDDRKFYVYMIRRPWDGAPCYIGKGSGSRLTEHHRRGVNHTNRRLAAVYRAAEEKGLAVTSEIVVDGLLETEAFTLETELIQKIGRGRKGPLCNQSDGGEGPSGAVRSQSLREHQSRVLKELYQKSPELREKVSSSTKRGQERNGAGKKISAAMSARMQDESVRRELSRKSSLAWAGHEKRRKQSETLRAVYANNNELRECISQSLVDGWANPETRKVRMAAIVAMNQPDVIARRASKMRQTVSTKEHRARVSEKSKQAQERIKDDPERYAAMCAKRSKSMKATLAAKKASKAGGQK